jgi:hypothetical protein
MLGSSPIANQPLTYNFYESSQGRRGHIGKFTWVKSALLKTYKRPVADPNGRSVAGIEG